ncbi:Zinc finger, C2H2 [Cynara cardunculus var. scolymus]|uniref:Zinc finger, C2H2 n=2 Tax=Cynara cardunculus var. scolymus TaxID=59895 RepID=A0A118JYE7_CYNCS|nr:Zinc finger, C2H2 [Cynara cardunculus var. scolymus]
MRSHVIAAAAAAAAANSSESDEKFANLSTLMINGNGNDPSGNGNSSSYGLRENPKKTWRAVGSSTFPFPNEKVCKQCGKGFQSLKALCGHMACHSDKDRGMKDYDHSWTSENLDHDDKVVTDSQSDTDEPELQDPTRVTRSKSKRYKKLVVKPYSFSLANTSNNSNYNYGSSSVSEIDELEQEEVAMCLMMLSKDSTNWAGVGFVVESSDNNSAVLETKSSSIDMRISKKSSVLDAESFQFENSNSGYSRNGTRKVESDISVEELLRNGDRNKNKSKGGRELSYEEKLEIRRNLFREFGYRDPLKKRIRNDDDSYSPELEREASHKKKNKYECLTCNKIFSSFQGLGGHRPCHKKNNLFASSKHNNRENSLEHEYGPTRNPKYEKKIRVKKSKGHECPTCFRMFKSGQALGGHRRSHFINGSIGHIAATENEAPTCSDMIDLNLPAPEED